MLMGEEARFIDEYNRWIEYIGCGYACNGMLGHYGKLTSLTSWNFIRILPILTLRKRSMISNMATLMMKYPTHSSI